MDHTHERRKYTRIPIIKDVMLYTGVACMSTQIYDVSLKGVLLGIPKDTKIKTGDLFRLSIPVDQSPAIIMNIKVVHHNKNTFGAEWTQIDMDSFTLLKRTIELNLREQEKLRADIKKFAE